MIQKYLLQGVSGLLVVALMACGVLYLRCGQLSNEVTELEQEKESIIKANKSSKEANDLLLQERDKVSRTTDARLSSCMQKVYALQQIDQITGGNDAKQRGGPAGNKVDTANSARSGDGLLDSLNRMYSSSTDSNGNGVCQAVDTGDTASAELLPRSLRYCFCSDEDVRNMLKNRVLDYSDRVDRITIQDGLR